MKTLKKIIAFCLFFCASLYGFAQVLTDDLAKTYEYYYNKEYYSVKILIEVYSTANQKMMTQHAEINKLGNLFLYKMEDSEMLISESNVILLNHYNKTIVRRSISPEERASMTQMRLAGQLDSVIVKYDSVRYQNTVDQKIYNVFTSAKMISRTEIVLDNHTNGFTKLTYYYKKKKDSKLDRVEMAFQKSEKQIIPSVLFSEEKYIIKEGTSYKAAPAFHNYELNIVNP